MKEKKMRQVLVNKTDGHCIKFVSIETGATALGIADTFYYAEKPDAFHGWCELKHVKTFDRNVITIPWRPGQLARTLDLVRAEVPIWLCMSADDTDEFAFIPARILSHTITHGALYNAPSIFVYGKRDLNGTIIKEILKIDQYKDTDSANKYTYTT